MSRKKRVIRPYWDMADGFLCMEKITTWAVLVMIAPVEITRGNQMNAIILGDKSEIAQAMQTRLIADGWNVEGWHRNMADKDFHRWDLILCAIGTVAPVGHWSTVNRDQWAEAITSNLLLPIRLLQNLWPLHNPNCSVCFLAGANPNKAPPNYSAYATGKMALLKAVEHMDAETPDAKMFCLAPGIVFTKIHEPTMRSGIRNDGLEERRKVGGTPMAKIYECLKWCMRQDKRAVGGRNICVSDIPESESDQNRVAIGLQMDSNKFKLRRIERGVDTSVVRTR